jgi:hypothetical protein
LPREAAAAITTGMAAKVGLSVRLTEEVGICVRDPFNRPS